MRKSGDFNAQKGEKCLGTFLYQHILKSLDKEATCHRNPNNPSCTDLTVLVTFSIQKLNLQGYQIVTN